MWLECVCGVAEGMPGQISRADRRARALQLLVIVSLTVLSECFVFILLLLFFHGLVKESVSFLQTESAMGAVCLQIELGFVSVSFFFFLLVRAV